MVSSCYHFRMVKKTKNKLISKRFQFLNKPLARFSKLRNTKYLALGAFGVLLLAFLYLAKGFFVAALVNKKPITRLTLVKALEQQSGQQTLDNLVTKELILQEAKKQNVTISNEEIEGEIDKLKKAVEGQGTTLDAALAMQGATMGQLTENIKMQKTIEKVLGADVEVSEEEIKNYYEQSKSNFGEGSKYEDLKEELRSELKQEKISLKFQEWIQKLRTDSEIIYFVNF